jgi:hypothetical protein
MWVVFLHDLDNQTSHPVATFASCEEALAYLENEVIVTSSRFDYYISKEEVYED